MKYKITQAPNFLYKIGVSFHGSGTIEDKNTGVKMFDYYKCDSITKDQKEKVLLWCPLAEFKSGSPKFAPEIKKVLICFPKAGYLKTRK